MPMMRGFRRSWTSAFVALLLLPPVASGQNAASKSPSEPMLSIRGEVERELRLSARALSKLPRCSATIKDHEGVSVQFEGYALHDVLRLAGVTSGDRLRGDNLRKYLIVDAVDAYQVVFALPELDPEFTDQVILLADRRDGKPLAEKEGPWRLVVPNDKRQARWIRQVSSLVIQRAENLKVGEKK